MLALSQKNYLEMTLLTWTIISIVWLASLPRAKLNNARNKKVLRLAVWLTIAVIEAILVSLGSQGLWVGVYGLACAWTLYEIGRASGAWSVIALTAAVTMGALYFFHLPSILVFVLAAAVLFALPYGGNRRWAVIAMCVCYVVPLAALAFTSNFASINTLLGATLLIGHVADIASGFGGKIGGMKPLPNLSPNKTMVGFGSGLLGAAACGLLLSYSFAQSQTGVWIVVTAIWTLAAMGDLAGSKFKRMVGIKDFSAVLGPHGGMGDRLDSIAPCICFSLLFHSY